VFLSAFTTKTAVLALILLFGRAGADRHRLVHGDVRDSLRPAENDIRRILAFFHVNQVGFMVCARHRHADGDQRRGGARLRAHHLQGPVVHERRRGGLPYRLQQVQRGGWPVSHHALDGGLRHRRRAGDLRLSADFRLHHQDHDLPGGRRRKPGDGLLSAGGGLGRRVPARGIKFPGSCSSSATRFAARTRREHGRRDGVLSVLCILFGVAPELLYRHLPYPVEYEAYTASKVIFYLQLLLFSGWPFSCCCPDAAHRDHQPDTDWLWRVALFRGVAAVQASAACRRCSAAARIPLARAGGSARWFGGTPGDDGVPTACSPAPGPIGTTALWIAVLLTAYVFFYLA
jgi:multicomponent Na+:H+ antiporter subunit D